MIRVTLPDWPPSLNNAYINSTNGGRVLTVTARAWKESAMWHILGQSKSLRMHNIEKIGIQVRLYGDWLTKDGNAKKVDISNRIKLLEDAAATVLKFDDRQVWSVRADKIQQDGAKRTEMDLYDMEDLP